MTRCEDLEEQLSLYVDDLLNPQEGAAVRAHLETCTACAGLVSDLSRIAGAARLLGPTEPPPGLYAQIAARLPVPADRGAGSGPTPGRPLWRWAAMAATLAVAATLAYVAVHFTRATSAPASPATTIAGDVTTVAAELELAVAHYEQAIRELDAVARPANERLDPAVAAAIGRSLNALDIAIAESRQALGSDPESEPARVSLFDALRRKVDLLQTTALIVNDLQESRPAETPSPAATGREL